MKNITTVTEKYQITILKGFRSEIKPGDIFKIERKNGTIILRKVDKE